MWNLLKVKSNIILLAVDTSRQSVQTYAMILVKEEIRIVCYLVCFSGHEIAISNCKKVSGILNIRERCNTKYFTAAAITIWRLDMFGMWMVQTWEVVKWWSEKHQKMSVLWSKIYGFQMVHLIMWSDHLKPDKQNGTMPQAGIYPLLRRHASYEASALPQATTAG